MEASQRPATISAILRAFDEGGARRLLLALLCGDLVFGVLYLMYRYTTLLDSWRFDIQLDRSYPEMFQYLKYACCAVLLILATRQRASWHLLAWASFFVYFLLDDSLGLHETLGRSIGDTFSFQPAWGLRLQDYGETLVTVLAGLFLLGPLAWAYRKGSPQFRKLSHDLILLVLALAFVGVFIDMSQMAVRHSVGKTVNFILRIAEDMGEMFVASVMVWYVFLMSRRNFVSPLHLSDGVLRFLPAFGRAALQRALSPSASGTGSR